MDRMSRAQQVVERYVQRRGEGDATTEAEFVAANQGLMPELGNLMRTLRLIDRAHLRFESSVGGKLAREDPAGSSGDVPPSPSLELDLFPGYEITRRIRGGGQGVVYEAIQVATRRNVAIKVLREGSYSDLRERIRFEREVQVLAALNHPHIVTVHDSGTHRGRFYYVMDYISGESLEHSVSRANDTVADTLTLFEKVASAVNAAHLRGVTHRDLKPSNIQIDDRGAPHILDFGLAKVDASFESPDARIPEMTITGQFVGSLPWASPEQVVGVAANVDTRTDVYSLGVMLFQRLTGEFPYPVVGNVRTVMDHIANRSPTRPGAIRRAIDDEVDTIVLKCLHKDRDRRYQSGGELARDIRHYLAGEPIDAKRDSTWYVLKKTIGRYRVPAIASLAAAILVVAFSVVMWRQKVAIARENDFNQLLATQILDLFRFVPDEVGRGQNSYANFFQDKAIGINARFDDRPAYQAEFQEVVASTLSRLNREDMAAQWLRKAVRLHRDVLHSDDRIVANRMLRVAKMLSRKGNTDAAERAFAEAEQVARRASGDREILADVLVSASAFRAFHKNEHEFGIQLAEQALELYRSIPPEGRNPSKIASTFMNLAGITHDQGEYEAAERHYSTAIAACEPDNRTRWHATRMLALCKKDAANAMTDDRDEARSELYEAARQLLETALEFELEYDHESVAAAETHEALAKLYADTGQLDLAEQHSDRELQLKQQIYRDDDHRTALAVVLGSRIRYKQGRYFEAHEPLVRAVRVLRQNWPDHWETAKAESILGAVKGGLCQHARRAGYDEQAAEYFAEAQRLVTSSFQRIAEERGANHYRTRDAKERLNFVLALGPDGSN